MRVLLDECLPKRLKRELGEHEAKTVPEMGWASIKNGALLRLAEAEFDVFLTVDRNLEFQQNIPALKLGIVALVAYSNDIDVLRPLMPRVRDLLPSVKDGKVVHVSVQK